MELDLNKFAPPDPTAPVVLDLAKCNKLIANARVMERLPSGPMFGEMAAQMKLLLDERGGFSDKINAAQGDVVRYQREAQNANVEIGVLRAELIEARKKIEELNAKVKDLSNDNASPGAPVVPAKRGRKGKVVQMDPPKAAAQ